MHAEGAERADHDHAGPKTAARNLDDLHDQGDDKDEIVSSAMLPRYIEAIRPRANSGFCDMNSGPGRKPQSRKAACSTAVEADPEKPGV